MKSFIFLFATIPISQHKLEQRCSCIVSLSSF